MSARTIWLRLRAAGATEAGTAGLMGNMQAESVMLAYNLQDTSNASLRMSDAEYTQAVDNGTYDRFTSDEGGYGLCQWTHPERKAQLLAYAQEQGVSIGNEDMQVQFCIKEMRRRNPGVWSCLCSTDDIYEAARRVCCEYEQPAVNNVDERYRKGLVYFNQFSGLEVSAEPVTDKPAETLDPSAVPETAEGYWPPRMLCEGMYGPDVAVIKALLSARGIEYDCDIDIDGKFDGELKRLVTSFQASCGLAADGIVGKQTWAALTTRN